MKTVSLHECSPECNTTAGSPTEGVETANWSTVDLTVSERCRLLAAERRRLVLEVLAGEAPPVDLDGLAAAIARRENGESAVDERTLKRVAIALQHERLPVLADAGVLDYDPGSNRIDPDG